jgi:hypothetical protein
MSSVQSFLRQRLPGNTQLALPSGINPNTGLYVFVAGPGNYVGNYPNSVGYVTTLGNAANNQAILPANALTGAVIRDMGKTIFASVSNQYTQTSTPTDLGTPGWWREIQVLFPSNVANATASSPFGVGTGSFGTLGGTYPAGNPADDGYGTFYIPMVLNGVFPGPSTAAPAVTPTLANSQLTSVFGGVL